MPVFFPIVFSDDGGSVNIMNKGPAKNEQQLTHASTGEMMVPPQKAKCYQASGGGTIEEVWI